MLNKIKSAMSGTTQKTESNVGKWKKNYEGLSEIKTYADETSYRLAADFLADVAPVEDWGCGSGGFRLFCKSEYIGVDGTKNPFVDKVVDLATYTTEAEGILLRHVLEHNPAWEKILANALSSFGKKLCIAVFTPFAEETKVIKYYKKMDVVDISFNRDDLIRHFEPFKWTSEEDLKTDSQYGIEHVFYLERK